ncbi:MAG: hypothetical protein KIS88_07490 [Anaerolineales bacterium]|nr:hypothetical protein [Anaerolineales bacterium]
MLTTPNEQQLIELLQHASPTPSLRLEVQLASAPWTRGAAVRRRIALALATLAACLLFAASPQGRVLAQAVFTYFVPAPALAFPLPMQNAPLDAPTTIATLQAPSGYATYTSIEAAQNAVDFTIHRLLETPQGFVLRGVSIQHDLGLIYTYYDAAGPGGGSLLITQRLHSFPPNPWNEVPADAIEKVTVAGMDGEYAQGMFVVYANAASAVWEPDAPVFRLRWGDGSIWFSIEKHGDVVPIEWLDKEAMIELGATLMNNQ